MKGGSTLVLKSEGVVKDHQADVLGVYRMIDSYNDRPVYKQDGGENYIYYSAASCSWLVGAVVGHQYGWLRNTTAEAGASRWVPDLTSGYQLLSLSKDLFECNFLNFKKVGVPSPGTKWRTGQPSSVQLEIGRWQSSHRTTQRCLFVCHLFFSIFSQIS